ncbi:outer membrane beta-barrel protein [Candidatus Symbiothrix dinenymphae]|uniref:outer membrane beta-barrel protein n=1 Tax=Candidatus Symbiothrix dinenymphae TaxID=467085 RepID=UPI0006C3C96F|nr:outer membrane beta-barrel protein [Candidatus Symbiothrix dinenymphae]GAP72587.1 hypothetical protein SAMD00024442_36_24 [Candidatus Symbiothrix dinenymphae]
MKRILLVAALAVSVFGSVQAQFHYGLKAGVNLVEPDVTGIESLVGFQVGPMIEFIVPVIGIGFDAAVLYSQDGFKAGGEEFTNKNVLIPVNLKYKLSLLGIVGAYAAAGPYASFNVDSDMEATKSFGAGLNFGIGAELFSKLQVGVTYQLGLTESFDASKMGDASLDTATKGFVISLAYWF